MLRGAPLQQQEALEAAVRKAVCQFELEFMAGSFAERIRVLVAPDMIVVRSKGVLSAEAQQLIHTEEDLALVKQLADAIGSTAPLSHRRTGLSGQADGSEGTYPGTLPPSVFRQYRNRDEAMTANRYRV